MNKPQHLEGLNPQQLLAATTLDGPSLILAGAGVGKTSTIVARNVEILYKGKANPSEILTLTFTNKAAKEMRERGAKAVANLGFAENPTFSTFHGWTFKFLKAFVTTRDTFEIQENFDIIDTTAKRSIYKKLQFVHFQHLKESDNSYPFKYTAFDSIFGAFDNILVPYDNGVDGAMEYYSQMNTRVADELLEDMECNDEYSKRQVFKSFIEYKQALRQNNAVDFGDLINLTIKIFKENSGVLNYVRKRYKYIMVDEFQDTNLSQMILLKYLVNPETDNICAVGDDSQSIYGWRGAEIEFIINFDKHFKNVKNFNLSTNYRSAKNIISIANALVLECKERHRGKELLNPHFTHDGNVKVLYPDNLFLEKDMIVNIIKAGRKNNLQWKDFAILYRTNMTGKMLEPVLIKNNIPYVIIGGTTLLEKKIVKEFIAQLQWIKNPQNSLNLEVILLSSGALTLKRIDEIKKNGDLSELIMSGKYEQSFKVNNTQKEKIGQILNLLELKKELNKDYTHFVSELFRTNPISQTLRDKRAKTASDKIQEDCDRGLNHLGSLSAVMKGYDNLDEFLEDVTLKEDKTEGKDEDKVQLMTIHASKGLEFNTVILPSFNQTVIPGRNGFNYKKLEEERRLAYVAYTRAKNNLIILSPKYDNFNKRDLQPSQFLSEAGITAIQKNSKRRYEI